MLRCESSSDLYPIRLPQHQALTASSTTSMWHQRLGHPGHPITSQILQTFPFQCNKSDAHSCSSCRLGKHVRLPFADSASRTFFPFQLVHSDVRTSPVLSHSGYKYYVIFLDDYIHYLWTIPLRNKSDVLPCSFISYVHTQFRLPIVAFQTDNGREYDSYAMRLLLSSLGTTTSILPLHFTAEREGQENPTNC